MPLIDTAIIFLISLLVGAIGIYAGVHLLVDRDVGFGNAAITALIGAIAWAVVSFFVGWLPLVGGLLTLLAWIGVINLRYPGDWGTAIGIGLVAWLVAAAVLYALSTVGIVSPSALGVPGA